MKRFFLLACVAAVGCSGGGLDHFLADAGTNPDSAQSVQSDGSHTLASLSDVCTALPPSGYLNPTNKTFVAAVPTGADLLALMQPSYTCRKVTPLATSLLGRSHPLRSPSVRNTQAAPSAAGPFYVPVIHRVRAASIGVAVRR